MVIILKPPRKEVIIFHVTLNYNFASFLFLERMDVEVSIQYKNMIAIRGSAFDKTLYPQNMKYLKKRDDVGSCKKKKLY